MADYPNGYFGNTRKEHGHISKPNEYFCLECGADLSAFKQLDRVSDMPNTSVPPVGGYSEASNIDPKDLENIKLPKPVKGKLEFQSTPPNRKDPSNAQGSNSLDKTSIIPQSPPTQIREAKQGGLETPEDTAKPSRNQADKPSPFDSDPMGKAYLDFASELKKVITPDIWKQLYDVGDIPKIIDLHFEANTDLSNPQEQRIAEYKQLLNELPEKQEYSDFSPHQHKTYNVPAFTAVVSGFNQAIDQCRAIIQAKIKEME